MSLRKQDPPNPTLALRNRLPMRLSSPMARETSLTSAAVFSQSAEMELIEEIRWARKALEASLESSGAPDVAVMICSRGTQLA